MKLKIYALPMLFTGIAAPCSAQTFNYQNEALLLNNAIRQEFYIQDTGYYREHAKAYPSEKPVSYLWGLCALLQADNEMEVMLPKQNLLHGTFTIVQKYYDTKPPAAGYTSYPVPLGGGDRFYDDNEWIGIAALDAYQRTKARPYLDLGKLIFNFMMTGYDTVSSGGLYWSEAVKRSKNTCSNGPAVLVALNLYEATKQKVYLDTALLIYNWVYTHLQSPEGLYYDNYKISDGHIDPVRYSYNAGSMLESAVFLYQLTKEKKYLDAANKTANSAKEYFLGTGKFRDAYWFNAVLLRGYIRLYKANKDPQYLIAFRQCINNALHNNKSSKGLIGKNKAANLVEQAGMLEMLARLAILQGKVF